MYKNKEVFLSVVEKNVERVCKCYEIINEEQVSESAGICC